MTGKDPSTVREEVIEALERSAEMYGLSRSAGRVYGVLYFAAEPLSIGDLVDRTGYAKSTISNVTRRLDRIGLIRRRSGSDARRVNFEAETDVWFVVEDVYRQYLQREMSATARALDRAEEDLAAHEDSEQAQADLERIRDLQATYADLREVLDLATNLSVEELKEALEAYEKRN